MKKLFILSSIIIFLTSCGSWTQIGNLTMVSNRNVDSKTDYVQLKPYVKGKATSNRGDALNQAIDNCVKSIPGGEYLMNVKIYTDGGSGIKVEGDVWGIKQAEAPKPQRREVTFNEGQKVSFKTELGKLVIGKIIGLGETEAVVEYVAGEKTKTKQIKYKLLTPIAN